MKNLLVRWYWWSVAYFERRFGCSIHDYIMKAALPVVEGALRKKGKLLDAACGSGNVFLENLDLTGLETTGVDIDPSVRETNKFHRNIVIDDIHNFKAVRQFDAVLSVFTWEHLRFPEKALANWFDSLEEGGVAVIVASNRWYYVSILDRLMPNFLRNLIWRVLRGRRVMPYPTFYKLCSKKSLTTAAAEAGFRCASYQTFDIPPIWFLRIPPIFVAMCSLMALFNRYEAFSPVRSTFLAVLEKDAASR